MSLIDFVNNYRKTNPTGWRKWLYGSLAAVAVLILIISFSISGYLKQRAIAKLKHERDVLQEEARQHEVDATLAVTEASKEEHKAAAAAAQANSDVLEQQATALTLEHATSLQVINAIRTWGDVDAHVK